MYGDGFPCSRGQALTGLVAGPTHRYRWECLSERRETGRRETGDGRRGSGDGRRETGRRETGDGRRETGDWGTGDGGRETGDGETGLPCPAPRLRSPVSRL